MFVYIYMYKCQVFGEIIALFLSIYPLECSPTHSWPALPSQINVIQMVSGYLTHPFFADRLAQTDHFSLVYLLFFRKHSNNYSFNNLTNTLKSALYSQIYLLRDPQIWSLCHINKCVKIGQKQELLWVFTAQRSELKWPVLGVRFLL